MSSESRSANVTLPDDGLRLAAPAPADTSQRASAGDDRRWPSSPTAATGRRWR